MSSENKIFRAAYHIFLSVGYHGAKLQRIADQAGVNKAAIFYYFRSKERLYKAVIKEALELILNPDCDSSTDKEKLEKPIGFFCTELYNNQNLFENSLKQLYPDDWKIKLENLILWLNIQKMLNFPSDNGKQST